jgi:hypothetical protein
MVEAVSHLKLLPASILGIFKVFEHIDVLSIDILSSSLKHFFHSTRLRFWVSGSLLESK